MLAALAAPVAAAVATGAAGTVTVTVSEHELPAAASAGAAEVEDPLEDAVPDEPDEDVPATAAVISAAVASSTKRFCEKIHPSTSSATSQVFPAPVLSES